MFRSYSSAVLLVFLFLQLVSGQQKPPTDLVGRDTTALDAAFDKHVVKEGPGLAVMVIRDGKVVYSKTGGKADLESGAPLRSDTPTYIASIGKQFTAVAIMMLSERGKLDYDDKLVKYFPEFSSFAGNITLRQMLTHTSGLVDHLDIMKDNVPGWTNQDVVELLKRENRVLFPAGERVSYSNSAYALLAMIVEKVSGESFSSFLKKNMFVPLGMTNTYVATKEAKIPGRARGYTLTSGKWTLFDYDTFTTGAAGIYSTLDDLRKWDQAFYSDRLIKPDTLKLASTANKLPSGRPTAFGFGWLAEFEEKGDLANVWYVATFGDFKGFKTGLKRIPDRRCSVIILTNQGKFPWDVLEKAQAVYAKAQ